MSDLIVDASKTFAQGEELSRLVKQLLAGFERAKDWPRERTAQALLAITYGVCRSAGWSPEQIMHRAAEQFTLVERAVQAAKAAAKAAPITE